MIICEGPDLGGKTVTINRLSSHFDLPVYHSGGPPETYIELLERLNKIEKVKDNFLFDRVPAISEPIYGSTIRGFTLINIIECVAWIHELKPIIVYCRPPDQYLISKLHLLTQHNKDHKSLSHSKQVQFHYGTILIEYDNLMFNLKKYVINHDFRHPISPLIKEILRRQGK